LQYDFDPIVFYPEEERNFGNFSLKLNTTNLPVLMDFVKQKWNAHFPESPYRFFFLDERFTPNTATIDFSLLYFGYSQPLL
jgi:putative ABC transport system permease protein